QGKRRGVVARCVRWSAPVRIGAGRFGFVVLARLGHRARGGGVDREQQRGRLGPRRLRGPPSLRRGARPHRGRVLGWLGQRPEPGRPELRVWIAAKLRSGSRGASWVVLVYDPR